MLKQKNQAGHKSHNRKLHLWPGVVIVLVQWLIWFVLPRIYPEMFGVGIPAGFLGGLLLMVWWAFFSRAARIERWGAVVLIILSLAVTSFFLHESLVASQNGLTYIIYGLPILSLAFITWAVVTRSFSDRLRRITMVAIILISSGVWTLLRTEGMTGDIGHEFIWRWADIPEQNLPDPGEEGSSFISSDTDVGEQMADWPGFRGAGRDGIIHGVRIDTNWASSKPELLWRKPVGPGLSSFAVRGKLLFTQEQRGEEELVSCYQLDSGDPVWNHRDSARFLGADANPGPRATPTINKGRLYSLGATGILNALDAENGSLIWTRNAAADLDLKLPIWGFSGSPLVTDSNVIVAVAGTLAAYDIATGEQKWIGPDGGDSYSSPQRVTINGVPQILLQSSKGVKSVNPGNGKLIWEHNWEIDTRIVQTALLDDDNLLISDNKGIRRISVKQQQDEWQIGERWTSFQLKPNFNDFVVHKGYVYGYHVQNLACMNIENGERIWRGARYGGQIILLADQDLLLLLSEKGELSIIKATPDKFRELVRFKVLEGKTWNHPVLVEDIFLVRNNQEMAAFRLSVLGV